LSISASSIVRSRTTHFRLSSLFIITVIVAGAFGFGHFVRNHGGPFAIAVLFALSFIFGTALSSYLISFCIRDVLGHGIIVPRTRPCTSYPDEIVDTEKLESTALAEEENAAGQWSQHRQEHA
jgi:hypothetical protein